LVNPPVPPQCIKRVEPQYSDAALHAHLEGSVVLQLTIDTEGKVVDVKVLKGLPLGLTDKAVEAAWRWTFKPSMLNGKAVSVIYNLSVIFRID
jgi:protein TonB